MSLIRLAFGDLRRGLRPVLLFALAWAGLQTVILSPLLSWALGLLVKGRGRLAVSNYDIAGFLISPAGVVFAVLTIVSAAALQLGQQSGFQILAHEAQRRTRSAPLAALWRVTIKLPRLAGLAALILLRLAVLLLTALGLLVLLYFQLPGGHDINFYLAANPPEWRRMLAIAGLILLLAAAASAYLLLRWILALPHLVTTGQRAAASLRESWRQTAGREFRLAVPLLLWWAVWVLASGLLGALFGVVAGLLLDVTAGRLERTAITVICLETTALALGTALTALASAVSQFIVARIYREVYPEQTGPAIVTEETGPEAIPRWRPVLVCGLGLALLVSAATTGWQLRQLDTNVTVQITAHRGDSLRAPENSLSALRAAIAAGADFVEIDVQTTRDGRVVLWHDADLMRAIRDPRRIGECTLAELQVLDVGSHFGPAFANERIATLEEAIAVAGDQIRLNVELKYNRPEPTLAPRVAQVLRAQNFLERCVVTSLDAAELRRFRADAPEVPIGLIVTVSLGEVSRLPVDFLSVNTRVARPALFSQARRQGKTLHVWTVNDRESALHFILLGADNLITDEPALLAGLRRELQELDDVERLALTLRQRFAR
jgi:glycerophosphoryl diester phosphodiesterase